MKKRGSGYFRARDPDERCEICGVIMREHPVCRICHVLVGPGYPDSGIDEDGLCGRCSWQAGRRREQLVSGCPDPAYRVPPMELGRGEAMTSRRA